MVKIHLAEAYDRSLINTVMSDGDQWNCDIFLTFSNASQTVCHLHLHSTFMVFWQPLSALNMKWDTVPPRTVNIKEQNFMEMNSMKW